MYINNSSKIVMVYVRANIINKYQHNTYYYILRFSSSKQTLHSMNEEVKKIDHVYHIHLQYNNLVEPKINLLRRLRQDPQQGIFL